MTMGVYAIRNKVTGRTYVGSSLNVETRIRRQLHSMRSAAQRGRHAPHTGSDHLYRDWLIYGGDAFEGMLLEVVESADDLQSAEQRHMDAFGKDQLYNRKPAHRSDWVNYPQQRFAPDHYRRKLDALLAAVMERPESAAILARAEAIERGEG